MDPNKAAKNTIIKMVIVRWSQGRLSRTHGCTREERRTTPNLTWKPLWGINNYSRISRIKRTKTRPVTRICRKISFRRSHAATATWSRRFAAMWCRSRARSSSERKWRFMILIRYPLITRTSKTTSTQLWGWTPRKVWRIWARSRWILVPRKLQIKIGGTRSRESSRNKR